MNPKPRNWMPLIIAAEVIAATMVLVWMVRDMGHNPDAPAVIRYLDEEQQLLQDAHVRAAWRQLQSSDVSPDLALITINDEDLRKLNQGRTYAQMLAPNLGQTNKDLNLRIKFPWPTFVYGQVVRELAAQKASVVGMDFLWPDSTPPNPNHDIHNPDGSTATPDEFFGRQMFRAGNVLVGAEGELLPLEVLRTNAAAVASVSTFKDYNVIRRVKPYSLYREWHPLIQDMQRVLGIDPYSAMTNARTHLTFALPPDLANDDPDKPKEPYIVPLNPNGTMKLSKDGSIDVANDPNDKGPETEYPYKWKRAWNLGLAMAARHLGLDLDKAVEEEGRLIIPGRNGKRCVIPTEPDGTFYVDWRINMEDVQSHRFPIVSKPITDHVLANDFQRIEAGATNLDTFFTKKLVLLGSIATGNNISDLGSTPLDTQGPLMLLHLNLANSVLQNTFVRRVDLWAELALVAGFGLISLFLTWRSRVGFAVLGVVVVAAAYTVATYTIYNSSRLWVPLLFPAISLVFTHFALVVYRVVFEQRQQRHIKSVFQKIVSPDVVTELLGQATLALGGARRHITVYFADVRGFTEFTDAKQAAAEEYVRTHKMTVAEQEAYFDGEAKDTLKIVNMYLSAIADQVKKHKGTLDKYIGDCVMAFWGAPVAEEKHAVSAVIAAIDSQRAMYALNKKRHLENEQRRAENEARAAAGQPILPMNALLSLGTGINTGTCIVGLMGSNEHILNYTVFGREVNMASRLEGLSGRGRIIISEATLQELKTHAPELAATAVELPAANLKGFRQAVTIFEIPWRTADMPDLTPSTQPQPAAIAPELTAFFVKQPPKTDAPPPA